MKPPLRKTAGPHLRLDERQVLGIQLGDQQRNVGCHPEAPSVAEDGDSGSRPCRFCGLRYVGPKRRERQIDLGVRLEIGDLQIGCGGRHRLTQSPAAGVPVAATRGALGGGEMRDLEPGVVSELCDEALADSAGRAEHRDLEWGGCHFISWTRRMITGRAAHGLAPGCSTSRA